VDTDPAQRGKISLISHILDLLAATHNHSMAHLLRHAQLASCAGWPCAAVEQWNIGIGTHLLD
jgi:hypothetical protein